MLSFELVNIVASEGALDIKSGRGAIRSPGPLPFSRHALNPFVD